MNKKYLFLTLPLLLASTQTVVAEDQRASMRNDRIEATDTLRNAQSTYRSIALDPTKKVPSTVYKKADCIAVFPSITSAAVAIGGAHGSGVAFCKGSDNNWGSPVFLDLNGASLGAQIGARNTDLVLYMNGPECKDQLTEGKLTMGGELSAVLGKYDESVVAPAKGMIAYSKNEGAFAGAALGGIVLSRDMEEEKAFYGTNIKGDPFAASIPAGNLVITESIRSLLPR